MIGNVKNIVNYAQANGFVFDLETLNLNNPKVKGAVESRIFSASFAKWGDRKPTTHYIQHSQSSLDRASAYSQTLYSKLPANTPWTNRSKFNADFMNHIGKHDYIVGHNLMFDLAHTYDSLDPEDRLKMQTRFQGKNDAFIEPELKRLESIGAKEEARKLRKYSHRKFDYGGGRIGGAIKKAHAGESFYHPYKMFQNVVNDARRAGNIAVVDTMQLSNIFAGLAHEKGILKLKGDNPRAFGHKLEFLAGALGRDTYTPGKAHTEMDVFFNQPLLDAFGNGDLDRIAHSTGFKYLEEAHLQEPTRRLIKMYEMVDKSNLSELNYFKQLDDIIIPSSLKDFNGRIPFKTESAYTRVARNVSYEKALSITGKQYGKDKSQLLFDIEKRSTELSDAIVRGNLNRDRIGYETVSNKLHSTGIDAIKKQIHEHFVDLHNPLPSYSTEGKAGAALSSSLKKVNWGKAGLIAGGAVAAATLYSLARGGYSAPSPQAPDARNHAFNPIAGLHPGGGINQANIQQNTDFGSPLNMKGGVSKAFGFIGDVVSGFAKSVRANTGIIGAAAIPGIAYGFHEGKKNKEVKWGHLGKALAIDMIDDVAVVAAPLLASRIPQFEKVGTFMKAHPSIEKGGMAFLGFTLGKTVGEILASSRFSGKDDAYNVIEGLHPGGGVNKANTKRFTDFGSGYQGPNPDLEPAYNKAKDVYRYEQFRASGIGKSEEDIYKWMTEEDKESSEFVAASASAGTAMHAVIQAQNIKAGVATGHEMLVSNKQHGISGHVDIERTDLGIGDIKTVNAGIFRQMVKAGKPKPQHYAQLQFYMAERGKELGYIQYVNRDQPSQQKVYTVKFDPVYYENLIAKVERVRARVLTDIAAGRLSKNHLPKTASLERLEEDNTHVPSPQEMVQNLGEYQQTFREEMSYLRTVKRGMPTQGAGYERIQANNKRKNNSWAQSTQGIGLQNFNDRQQHHRMQGYGV